MPVAILASGIVGAVAAAAGVYARIKKKGAERREEARMVERLDSIALKDAAVAPDQRLFVAAENPSRKRSN